MYKKDLALNNLQWLICHKTQPNQTKIHRLHLSGEVRLPNECPSCDSKLSDGEAPVQEFW